PGLLHCICRVAVPLSPHLSFPTRRSSDLAPCVTMPYMCLFTFLPIFRLKGACLGDGINAHLFGMPILSLFPPPTFSSKMDDAFLDRKSTRLNSSHVSISYAVFCLKKNNKM